MKNTTPNPLNRAALIKAIVDCKRKYSKVFLCAFSLVSFSATNKLNAQTYSTIAAGAYTTGSTWLGGIVPPAGADVTIKHAVLLKSASATAKNVTIAGGGVLTVDVSGALMAVNALNITGGSLATCGGTINVGTSGGGNKVLSMAGGSLKLSSGVINVNGRLVLTQGSFNMVNGNLKIDPNTGASATSVAANTDIFSLSSAVKTAVTGGNITFVDPPYAGSGKSFAYTGNGGDANWAGNTMIFGDANGKNTNAGATNGFNVDTKASGSAGSYIKLGHVIINGGAGTNRLVTGSSTAANGFDIGGNLTINSASEVRTLAGGAVLRIQGNIYNKGRFIDLAGISFSGRTGPNTVAQYVTNFNKTGLFLNNANLYAANAHFTGLEFNNTAKPIAVTFNNGDGKVIDGAVGISGFLNFTNGAIDIGSLNQFVMRKTCAVTRVNGFLIRGGGGQMVREFPLGASTFTYHISDADGNFDYTPVTISLTANNYDRRIFTITQRDTLHPNNNYGGKPSSYISRYWQIVCTSPGTFAGTMTFAYLPEDINGNENVLKLSNWDGATWRENSTIKGTKCLSVKFDQASFSRTAICHISGRTQSSTTASRMSGTSVAPTTTPKVAEINTNNNSNVTVFPNPVTGSKVNIRLASLPAAKYNVSVFNQMGQPVYTSYVNHTGGTNTQDLQLPANLPSGIYSIGIKDGIKGIAEKELVVNN